LIGGSSPYESTGLRDSIVDFVRTQAIPVSDRLAAQGTMKGIREANRNATNPSSSTAGITGSGAALSALQAASSRTAPQQGRAQGVVDGGGGNNEAARQALFARTPTLQEGAAARQGTAGDPTTFGRFQQQQSVVPPQFRDQFEGIQSEIEQLSQVLNDGLNTRFNPGINGARRGMSARRLGIVADRLGQLEDARDSILGARTDIFNSQEATNRALQQQELANQGAAERANIQGEFSLQGIQDRINDPLNQARADAARTALSEVGVEFTPPELPENFFSLPEEQRNAALNRFQQQQTALNRVSLLVAEAGGNAAQVRDELQAAVEQNPDDAQLGQMLAELSRQMSQNNAFVPRGALGSDNGAQQPFVGGENPEIFRGTVDGVPTFSDQPIQNFADGGIVGGSLNNGPVGSTGGGLSMPMIQQYQQYVQLAQKMGVPPVQLEEFASLGGPQSSAPTNQPPMPQMQQGAQGSQNIIGMAGGGMVPEPGGPVQQAMQGQVDGKMVVDPNEAAPTDSIPAMIDGTQPARLDSGEFVLPADVVMHFGTDKLKKMIEQARNAGAENGGEPQTQVSPA